MTARGEATAIHVLLNASAEVDNEECDYALVTISEALAKKLAQARKKFTTVRESCDLDLRSFYVCDQSASYFAQWRLGTPGRRADLPPRRKDLLSRKQREDLVLDVPVVLDGPIQLHEMEALVDDVFAPVEEGRLVITDDFFWWTAFVKSTDSRVFTSTIPYHVLNHLI